MILFAGQGFGRGKNATVEARKPVSRTGIGDLLVRLRLRSPALRVRRPGFSFGVEKKKKKSKFVHGVGK